MSSSPLSSIATDMIEQPSKSPPYEPSEHAVEEPPESPSKEAPEEMHERHSRYHDLLKAGFGEGMPLTTGFGLDHITINPQPTPEVNVILVTGNTTAATQNICNRFASDFNYHHINVPTYLHLLASQGAAAKAALTPLHPSVLSGMLEVSEKGKGVDVPASFLLQIPRYKTDEEVRAGQTRFMISGLDEDAETAMRFAEKIAKPAAVFSLTMQGSMKDEGHDSTPHPVSDVRAATEENYANVLLRIELGHGEAGKTGYDRLFGVISQKACAVREVNMVEAT